MTPEFFAPANLRRDLSRWRTPALYAGIFLLAVSFIAAFFFPGAFYHAYLTGYLLWLGVALGSMAFLMTHHLTGGAWGIVTRRIFESAIATLPLLALLFLPFVFGLRFLYAWARPDEVKTQALLQHRAAYMNPSFFIIRAVLYLAVWIAIAHYLKRWSREQDSGVRDRTSLLEKLSAPGLIVYVFTITFASVDWAESLRTEWFSTMWGFLFVASQGLTAIAFVIGTAAVLSRYEPMRSAIRPSHFQDLGNLFLMMVMIWAYFAFSQLLIVWAGNLTDEIPWYLPRFWTSWGWIGVALIVFEFVVPFLMLLFSSLKRNARTMCIVVGIVLAMRFIDMIWVVVPSYSRTGIHLDWLDFAVPLGIGGLWLWVFLGELPKRPLLPVNAPELEEALAHGED